jgi:protein phosphatase
MMCSDGLSGMIRADEIKDVLSAMKDPLEACRELTDRANAAGGHDNITVIVAQFHDGLEEPTADMAFGYQKYALPDITPEASEVTGARDQAPSIEGLVASSEVSAEAQRESRRLRVSHTMVGMVNPLETTPISNEVPPGLKDAAAAKAATSASPKSSAGASRRGDRISEEPVALPTNHFPPALMAVIVVCAMLLAGLFGYLVLR